MSIWYVYIKTFDDNRVPDRSTATCEEFRRIVIYGSFKIGLGGGICGATAGDENGMRWVYQDLYLVGGRTTVVR
jgi:hypothetical protein